MKAKVLVDGGSPKVSPAEVARLLERKGFEVSQEGGEIAIVVGGDGKFGRYGRTESIPLLFVGMRSKRRTGSRAYLAEVHFDELPKALEAIEAGKYHVEEHQRLAIAKNGENLGEVFTDVYLQRGAESTCLRYRLAAKGEGVEFEESAIGDGVVVTTSAGSTGFYSYPDRIRRNTINPRAFTKIPRESIGICHIIPTYTERIGTTTHPLRYELP